MFDGNLLVQKGLCRFVGECGRAARAIRLYPEVAMKKRSLIKLLAENSRISEAKAADAVDRAVNQLVTSLKRGEPAKLPGLGAVRAALKVRPAKKS